MGNCVGGTSGKGRGPVSGQGAADTQAQAQPSPPHSRQHASAPPAAPAQQYHPQPQTQPPGPHAHRKPLSSLTANVLGRDLEDIRQHYTLGRELGRGQFGVTHLATHKGTQELYACKSIAKRKLTNREDVEDVRREVQIMHHLAGQENVVELKAAFEDKHSVHLVMELCAGGELFDRIIQRGHYSERAAAGLCRTIVQVVQTCHSLGVIHRDLKPENFLLANKTEESPLKATDFGLSVFFKHGEVHCHVESCRVDHIHVCYAAPHRASLLHALLTREGSSSGSAATH